VVLPGFVASRGKDGNYVKGQGLRSQQQKVRNTLFPQCQTSFSNNSASASITQTAVKFAYSMECSAKWRIEWCDDRHLHYVTGNMHSRVVCLRLEGNLVVLIIVSFMLERETE